MNANKPHITVIAHVYYPGSWEMIRQKCAYLLKQATNIIITVCHEDVMEEIDMPGATVLRVTNKGKDIGGKFAGLAYYFSFCKPTEYMVLLHDKVSPQTINADFWFDRLYEIFEESRLKNLLTLFDKKQKVGIAGSRYFLKNEYIRSKRIFDSTNNSILQKLIRILRLQCKTYNYIGGTIFLARTEIFNRFFSLHHSLDMREHLETGNVLDLQEGTYTHSWERLLCFMAQAQGYKVIGV